MGGSRYYVRWGSNTNGALPSTAAIGGLLIHQRHANGQLDARYACHDLTNDAHELLPTPDTCHDRVDDPHELLTADDTHGTDFPATTTITDTAAVLHSSPIRHATISLIRPHISTGTKDPVIG